MLDFTYLCSKLRLKSFYKSFSLGYSLGQVPPPKFVVWDCTRRCNLDCKHCGAKKESYEKELSTSEVKEIISELANYNVEYFTVTGGEPLVRKDLLEIFAFAKSQGLKTGLATNGFFIDDKNCKDIVSVFDSVQISIDGREKTHNEIRDNPLAFQKAVGAIKLLKRNKCKQISVSSVISPINLIDFEYLADLMHEIEIDFWKVVSVMPIGKVKNCKSLYLSKEDFIKLLRLTEKYREKNKGKLRIEFGENLGYLGKYDKKVREEPFFCPVGFLACCIGVDGSVRGCPEQPDISLFQEGNVLKTSLQEIWERGFKKYRDLDFHEEAECGECKFRDDCRGGCRVMRLDKINCSVSRYDI